jgi:hypothetical protein
MKTIVTLLGMAFLAVGCAAPVDGQSTEQGQQTAEELTFGGTSGEGGPCGGFTFHPKHCAAGLVCSHVKEDGTLINPDVPGVCRQHPYAGYDQACGGFILNSAVCVDGLACSRVDTNGNFINPDLPGVCLEDLGQHCGGFIIPSKKCAYPYHCQLTPPGDQGGTCEK